MTVKTILDRVAAGEVVPVGEINGRFADEYIKANPQAFVNLTVENDMEKADVVWIYDKAVRSAGEFNPGL